MFSGHAWWCSRRSAPSSGAGLSACPCRRADLFARILHAREPVLTATTDYVQARVRPARWRVRPNVAAVGIDAADQAPRAITRADIDAADLVVTLTGVEDLPPLDSVCYEVWKVDGHIETLEQMRDLRDALSGRVADLLARVTRADSP